MTNFIEEKVQVKALFDTEKARLSRLEKVKKEYAKKKYVFKEYVENGKEFSYAIFLIDEKIVKENKKKKLASIVIAIIFILGLIWAVSGNDKIEVVEDVENKKEVQKENKSFSPNRVKVSDFNFTLKNKQAVSLTLFEEKNTVNYITITIQKNKINKGYTFDSNTNSDFSFPLDVTGQLFNKQYKLLKNTLYLSILEYDTTEEKATFKFNAILANVNNENDTLNFEDAKISVYSSDFKLLKKTLSVEEKKMIDEKEMLANAAKKEVMKNSIAKRNIDTVIKSLKDNYNISAINEWNKSFCSNENFCEAYADKVQIQAIRASVDVLINSDVTPSYYQTVCSAVLIGLTGINKELAEQTIVSNFNNAAKNGGTGGVTGEQFGVDVKIRPNSSGLLGCRFYKR